MIHLAALMFAFSGFTALCAATPKHQRDLLGRTLPDVEQGRIRWGGQACLACAFAATVLGSGWKFGAVEWVGLLTLGALALTLLIPYRPRLIPRLGIGAVLAGGLLLAYAMLAALR